MVVVIIGSINNLASRYCIEVLKKRLLEVNKDISVIDPITNNDSRIRMASTLDEIQYAYLKYLETADVVIAVSKPNGSFGEATSYEIAISRYMSNTILRCQCDSDESINDIVTICNAMAEGETLEPCKINPKVSPITSIKFSKNHMSISRIGRYGALFLYDMKEDINGRYYKRFVSDNADIYPSFRFGDGNLCFQTKKDKLYINGYHIPTVKWEIERFFMYLYNRQSTYC